MTLGLSPDSSRQFPRPCPTYVFPPLPTLSWPLCSSGRSWQRYHLQEEAPSSLEVPGGPPLHPSHVCSPSPVTVDEQGPGLSATDCVLIVQVGSAVDTQPVVGRINVQRRRYPSRARDPRAPQARTQDCALEFGAAPMGCSSVRRGLWF